MSIDVAIAGVQKAGTTSLLRWLGQHPAIQAQQSMELTYFIDREAIDLEELAAVLEREFPGNEASGRKALMKHVGLFENAQALRLLKRHNPEMKLIVVLREPASRAWSAFWYARSKGFEPESDFEKAAFRRAADFFESPFQRRSTDYVGKGFYHHNLRQMEQFFSPEQCCILTFEALKSSPQAVCDRVFEFLQLPSHHIALRAENPTRMPRFGWMARLQFWAKPLIKILPRPLHKYLKKKVKGWNTSDRSAPELPAPLRERLRERYREENRLLFEDYGIDYR